MRRFAAVLFIGALAVAGCSSSSGDGASSSDGSSKGGRSSEGICSWISKDELVDAGYADPRVVGASDVKSNGKAIPNCTVSVKADGTTFILSYSVHPSDENSPEDTNDTFGTKAIDGVGDKASVSTDPSDPDATSFTIFVAVGDQNLTVVGDTRVASQEATLAITRKLVDAMREDPPAS